MNDAELAIRLTADATDAARSFDATGDAALAMADDVDRATRDAAASTSRLDDAADSVDQLGSNSSQAAGGLGDLGGALALMPGPLGAVGAGMEAVAPAIMGVTGAADLMSLAMNSNIVVQTRAKAAAIAHRTVTIAQAAATKGMAVAQRILNVAMRANPIGLAVTAITLLVAGLILAYKKSETFRRVVNAVFTVAKTYVMAYVKVITTVVGFLRDKLPAAALWLRDKVVAVWDFIRDKGEAAWNAYVETVQRVIDKVRSIIDKVRDTVVSVGDKIRDALGGAFDWVMDKVQPILDAIESIGDKLGGIGDVVGSIPGFGRAVVPVATTSTSGYGSGDEVTIVMPPLSALSLTDIGRLVSELDRYYASRGQRVELVAL